MGGNGGWKNLWSTKAILRNAETPYAFYPQKFDPVNGEKKGVGDSDNKGCCLCEGLFRVDYVFVCSHRGRSYLLSLIVRWLEHVKVRRKKSDPITGLDRPWGFQEVEAPRFQDSRHMKVVRLSALRTGRQAPRKYSWYSFMLEADSTPGPWCDRKDYVNEKFQWHHRESSPGLSGL